MLKIIKDNNTLLKLNIFYRLVEYKDDRFPDSTFYHKNGKIHFELDTKNNILWCNYVHVWRIFSNDGELYYDEVERIIKNLVEQHTNWGSMTPQHESNEATDRWNNIQLEVNNAAKDRL